MQIVVQKSVVESCGEKKNRFYSSWLTGKLDAIPILFHIGRAHNFSLNSSRILKRCVCARVEHNNKKCYLLCLFHSNQSGQQEKMAKKPHENNSLRSINHTILWRTISAASVHSLPMAQFSTLYFTFQLMRLKRHSGRFPSLPRSADEASRLHRPIEANTKGQFWTMRNGDYFGIALLKMHYTRFGRCLLLLKKRNGCVALESFWGLIMLASSRSFAVSLYLFVIHGNRNTFLHHVSWDYTQIYNKEGDGIVVVVVVFYAIEKFSFCLNRLWADCKS